ncbi:MAG TPA: hypothetical protein VGQ83_18760 [Polyangia bacterium]
MNTHSLCAPMDVAGQGDCDCVSMGWEWTGSTCVQLSVGYCTCVGADCDKLARTQEECASLHASCL